MAETETVAVLGAGGTMGFAMAHNILRAGIPVRAWNRSRDKAEPLAADGATIAHTPAEAARGAGVIVTMLSDTGAVIDAMDGPDGALGDGDRSAVWVQMSTLGLQGSERCAELAGRSGIAFVDAPVLGTKQPAEQGELIVMASGPEDQRDRLEPIFDAVGRKTLWLGEAGAGSRLKVVTNSWLVTVVEGAAETVALAEGIGVDPHEFIEAISGGPLDMPYLEMKSKAMIERDFTPSFRLALGAKDAALVTEAAEQAGLDLPVLRAVRARMAAGAEEHGDEDLAATFLSSVAP